MIKPELIQAIANKTKMPKKQIEVVIDTMVETITTEVKDGHKVLISGFGLFYSANRKSRNGINPVTKAPIRIKSMQMPKFRAGERFKRVVRSKS
ncbi:MAG: HU family DNA-binding protein [Patescibacteria group bacterium]|nr:HU family DNA-binding protein [Patescibacteria group bacterium]